MSRKPSLPKPTTSFCIDSQTFSLDVLTHHLPPWSPLALSLLKSVTGYQCVSGAETSLFIESRGKWQGSLLVTPSAQRLCKGGSSHLYDFILENPIYPQIQFHTDTPLEKKPQFIKEASMLVFWQTSLIAQVVKNPPTMQEML